MQKYIQLSSLLSCFLLVGIFVIEFEKLQDWNLNFKQQNNNPNSNHRVLTIDTHNPVHNKWNLPKEIIEQRFKECDANTRVSKTGGYCLPKDGVIGGNHIYDRRMAEYLANNIFAGKTVVDLGAGLGHYGRIFNEEGSKVSKWEGYDGALNVNEVTNGLVNFMDLTQPDAADERDCVSADWVLSLEVGEHIPPEYTENFLRNIRCHAREGAVISWAQPGQGGTGHVNTRTVEDVMALMKKWGFKVDHRRTDEVRHAAKRHYFARNVVVYVL